MPEFEKSSMHRLHETSEDFEIWWDSSPLVFAPWAKDMIDKADPADNVCSIGFCEKDQKWYGWSHRAIHGFGIGDEMKKGMIGYDEYKGPKKAKKLEDCKLMAIAFAKEIS